MNTPYIGITDFTNTAETREVLSAKPMNTPRKLHVGVMTSYKFLHGQNTKWRDIWLKPYENRLLFQEHPRTYNVIHYADYDPNPPTTYADLVLAVASGGNQIQAIQLDMVWPDINILQRFSEVLPYVDIILQVSSVAINKDPHWATTLKKYEHLVSYVLIDAGMGKGIDLEVTQVFEQIERVLETVKYDSRIAVAGGLGPYTYQKLQPLFEQYPNLSCDAQSKLRLSGNAMDPLDIEMCKQYVAGVSTLIK